VARPKKLIRFKLTPFKNSAGTQSWRVTGTKSDGTRIRKNFSEKREAVQEMADLESSDTGHDEAARSQRTRLTPDQLADAEAAISGIGNRKLADLIRHYLQLEARAAAKGITLDRSAAFVDSHYRSEVAQISLLNAREEFIRSRTAGSALTTRHYRETLKVLLKPDPNKAVHDCTVSDIEKALSRFTNVSTRRTYRQVFSVFFNWAVRHHYCLENPCKRLDKLPKDMTQISILSLPEVKRILWAAVHYQNAAAAPGIAIALFAGLRPSELADLKPDDIGKERIRVTGGKMRRKLKRTVPIAPILRTWLDAYPFKGLPSGWDYKFKKLKAATQAESWSQDILRHTSISFQTERDKNEPLTAYHCGTSVAMMDRHYRNTIDDPTVVAEFWDLGPDEVIKGGNPAAIILPSRKKVAWPSKASLAALVQSKPLVHAAKEIGVSDVALKKHCLKLGITLPPRGHWLAHTWQR
jgi:integrase